MMNRTTCGLVVSLMAASSWVVAQRRDEGVPPLVFEVSINGESFLVEAETQTEVKSKKQPGVTYQLALRLAPQQRWALNSVKFEYDGKFRVEDDNDPQTRTATLTHELGFILSVIDLGDTPAEDDRPKLLQKLVDSLSASHRQAGDTQLQAKPSQPLKFGQVVGHEVVLQYLDRKQTKYVERISFLVAGPRCAAYIVQYPLEKEAEMLPMARISYQTLQPK